MNYKEEFAMRALILALEGWLEVAEEDDLRESDEEALNLAYAVLARNNKVKLSILTSDVDTSEGAEGWSRVTVLSKESAYTPTEEEVLAYLDSKGISCYPYRADNPGGCYTDEPWIRYYDKLIVVMQSGGRDM